MIPRDRELPLNPWKARKPLGYRAKVRKARKVSRESRRRNR